MPTYDKKNNNYRARFFVLQKNNKKKRLTKSFPDKRLAELFEYKKDIEFFFAKTNTDYKRLSDYEIDIWIDSFLKRRIVPAHISRANLKTVLAQHLKSNNKISVNILDALKNHVERLKLKNTSPSTIKNYSSYIKKIAEALEFLNITYHNEIDVDLNIKVKEIFPDVSNRTIDIYINCIKAALKSARTPEGDWKFIEKLDTMPKTRQLMSVDEIDNFLAAAKNYRPNVKLINNQPYWHSLFYLLFITSRRLKEITHRKWKDVRTDLNILIIEKQKGNAGPVYCPINDEIMAGILKIKNNIDQEQYIFPNSNQNPITNQIVGKTFKKIAQAANLPAKYSPHYLRHASITYLALINPDVGNKEKMAISGHKSTSGYNIYNHLITTIQSNIKLPTINSIKKALKK